MTQTKGSPDWIIRRALPEEAPQISELALRSKAYWGYDAKFIEACRPGLTLTPGYIRMYPVFVVEGQLQLLAFYSLVDRDADVELDNLFVEPSAIGQGIGKRLFQHAVETARQLGFQSMIIESEPNAEGFYQAMGAVQIGERVSSVQADRLLPLLRLAL